MNSRQVLTLVVSSVVCFQSTLAQQSTTGPTPPPNTAVGYKAASATQVVVPGVPAYLWRCGCGPTAVGMVVGYWDSNGYPGLIAGSASSQTGAVDSAIATPEHYDDYSLPLDYRPNLLADKSTLGGAHASNSIADFMNTSWSSRGNYYGWSWNSDIGRSFTSYVAFKVALYAASSKGYSFSSTAWGVYKDEVDQGRPVVLLVDSDADGATDHFVTGIGYDQADSTYGVYNTWDRSVHWYHWSQKKAGTSWGVYGFTTFSISGNPTVVSLVSPLNGASGLVRPVTVSWGALSGALSYQLQVSTDQTFSTLVDDQSGLTGQQTIVNGLANNATYYWRVRATTAGGAGPWSTVWSFATVSATDSMGSLQVSLFDAENWGQPGINAHVVLYNSIDDLVNQAQANSSSAVTFDSLIVESGYYYRVYYSKSTAWGDQFWGEKTGITAYPNQTTYDTLVHNTPYMPNVSVYLDNTSELLPDSAMRVVQPGTRIRVELQIKNPAYDGAQTVSAYGGLYLDRDRIAPYDVALFTSAQTYEIGTTRTAVFYCDAPSIQGSYYLSVGAFASSDRYASALTDASGWHDPAFTVAQSPNAPILTSPADRSINQPTSLRLSWRSVAGALAYHLQLATDSTFASGVIVNDSTIVDTSRVVSSLLTGTTYFWRVRARTSDGLSQFTLLRRFRTLLPPPAQIQLISPASGTSANVSTVGFVWRTASPEVTRYWFEMASDSQFAFKTLDSTLADTFCVRLNLANGTYWWKVKAYNTSGWGVFSEPRRLIVLTTDVRDKQDIPAAYVLYQNYPNPFNPSTVISFGIPSGGMVSLKVFSTLGQEVAVLVQREMSAGYHSVTFDASHLTSGVYVYRMQVRPLDSAIGRDSKSGAGSYAEARKLLLVR